MSLQIVIDFLQAIAIGLIVVAVGLWAVIIYDKITSRFRNNNVKG